MSIYDHEKNLKAAEDRIEKAGYSNENKALILRFENSLFAEGLKSVRVKKYLTQLNILAQNSNKNFSEMNLDDVQALVARIERSKRSDWTKHDYKITIRRFFQWMGKEDLVSWIKVNMKQGSHKLPEELLSESEIKKMIEVAEHPRDKAIIAALYDSGCRIGELGGLKIKHLNFDQYGAILTVNGKTGMRRVRVIFSVPYLASWLDIHPQKDNPDAYLWILIRGKGNGKPMQYSAFRKLIGTLTEKAGIKKRVYNHLFRHSRSTELAQHLTESQMEAHLGWVHGSDMPSVYVHLSGKQVDDAMLRIYGMKKKEDMIPELTSKACPVCEKINSPTSKFCSRCGHILDLSVALELEEIEDKIPELMEVVLRCPEAVGMMQKMYAKMVIEKKNNGKALN
ncbi:tyrosine-type recombinase/integrase [Methanosarcina sp. T3]|uniref:tyrosine-type recombinase/integrase n=1 Tax=Methanosarcina sp. T3 TaxID=3439062 RepID=UPI003F8437C5